MSNMSYCRWQNTYNDLCDCAGDLECYEEDEDEKPDPLSESETSYREQLLFKAADMLEAFGVEVDRHDLQARITALGSKRSVE